MATLARWLVCLSLVACSDDDGGDGGGGSGGTGPSNTGGAGGSSVAAGGKTGAGGSGTATGSTSATGGKTGDGGAETGGARATGGKIGGGANTGTGGTSATGGKGGDSGVTPTKECADYCTCMANNCADQAFPGGCLAECAEQTTWDLPCRQNMCNLAPVQPANNHCRHAAGIDECLNH